MGPFISLVILAIFVAWLVARIVKPDASKEAPDESGLEPGLRNTARVASKTAGRIYAALKEHLDPGEEPKVWVAGVSDIESMGRETESSAVLLATDRRVFFYCMRGLGGYDMETFPFGNISSLETSKRMGLDAVRLFATGNQAELRKILDDSFEEFVRYVRSQIGKKEQVLAPADAVDQLAKLGELREKGVLTEEEFAAKKQELLAQGAPRGS
ncbi:MAG: PH domain-containing protein [Rhodothermales bacterium]|nr:PH domain-containing protein [Rhodothermales bacterium]